MTKKPDRRFRQLRVRTAAGRGFTILTAVDRREFLRLSAAAGLVSLLGCGKKSDPGSTSQAATASPDSTSAARTAPTSGAIADQAAALENDLARIFAFVQSQVRYEPYAGILRGARGALASRAGNSADQASLLAALLQAGGTPCRFCVGSLTDADVATLFKTAVIDTSTARTDFLAALAEDAKIISRSEETAPGKEPPPPRRPPLSIEEIGRTARRQFDAAIGTIQSTLARANVHIQPTWSEIPRLEREKHVWIQARIDSKWIDLDPSFPASSAGQGVASHVDTMDALPDEMRWRVKFVVLAETWRSGHFVENSIMEHADFADALFDAPVCFTHVKADDLRDINLLGGSRRGTQYHPALEIGGRVFLGDTPLNFGGAPQGGAGGGAFVDALGGAEETSLPDGESTAEWLEVVILAPDGNAESAVRNIFDRTWEHRRDDGSVDASNIPPVELIDLPSESGEFLPCRIVHAFAIATGRTGVSVLAQAPKSTQLGPLTWPANAYHHVRDALMIDVGLNTGVRAFIDGPGVVSFTIETIAGATALETLVAFDVWHRSFGVLPLSDRKPDAPPLMVAGVLSHVAERCIALDGYADHAAGSGMPSTVGAVFERAAAEGISIRLLRGSTDTDLPYSAHAKYLLSGYLKLGAMIVITAEAASDQSRMGWWLVSPTDGWSVDMMDDGRGNAEVEYQSTNFGIALRVISCAISFIGTFLNIYQYFMGPKHSQRANEVMSWAQIILGVIDLVTGAGCVSDKWVPKVKPPTPRYPSGRPWGLPMSKAEARCC